MGCDCGKPKCDGHCGVSPAVLQINNPSECVLFHRVEVPASMGDSKTNPPKPGAYKNTLLYYKADGEAFLYSSDGIPTKITGVANDYACLENKPQINGVTLEGNKSLNDIGVTDAINNALEPYTPTSELAEVAFTGDYNDLENTPPKTFARFYMLNPSVGNAAPIYHDYRRTDQVTLAQFTDAIASGPVQIYMEYDGHTFRIYYVDQMDAFIPDPPMATGTLYVSFGLRDQYGLGVRRFLWYEPDTAPIFDGYDSNQSDWNETSSTNSSYIKNKPNLAAVATSGSYNDLTNKPTIPTVNNATLTIQKNGTNVQTFTANQSTNATANITVPTKTSDLTNDGATGTSVYVEESDITPSELSGEGELITLEGTTDCSALGTQLLGNAEQTTYSGKNLLPPTADWTQTVSGVTITCSNGQYTFSGTATANGSTTARATVAQYTIQSGDYFHYGNTLVSDQINIQIVFTDATYFATSMNATNRIVSLESYVGKTIASCRVNFASGNAFNGVVKPMILHNVSTTSDYEPYVGGIPAPNPSYPQPISTVTGEQTIQVTGKNLFNFQEFAQDKIQAGGVIRGTATATGDSITITATENDAYTRVDFAHGYPPTIRVKNNTDYVLSWKTDNTSGTNMGVVYVFARGSNNQNIIIGYRQDTAGSFQFNTGAYSEVTFRFGVATSGNSITYSNIMLEYGSQPSEYKPYDGTQSYEVNLGKNLLNINSLVKGGVTVSDGVATGQGQHFYAVFGQNTNGVSFIKRGGQLSISLKAYTDGNQAIEANDGLVVRVIYTDGTSAMVIRFLNNQTTATTKTYTTAAGKDVASIQLTYANDGGNIWHISEFQIEKGGQATSYAPYFTPIELAKIGTYHDRIYKNDGKWYVEKQVGKVVFDGTTTLTQLQASTNTTRVVATISSEYGAPLSTVQLPLCDYFTGNSSVWATDVQGAYIQSRYTVLRANNTTVGTTLDSFKTWLTSHPTTVYYALATPTTTEITDETLIGQLEALAGALGYDGVTNIISTLPELPATLSVSTYTGSAIPSATRARAGIVRIGDGIDVDDCGTISVSAQKAPTVNNATLTIQKNGTTVGTFTANASSNATANITVPTKTSDVTNDSGFLTSSTLPIAGAGVLGAISVGAGLEISSGGVLSATGGGTADAVAWGHVTGTLADQTDLQTVLNGKQASLSTAQLDAANSGITSAKVSTYDGYASTIARKANSADVPVITMQTTDPGEGATLAANTFIGVYNG